MHRHYIIFLLYQTTNGMYKSDRILQFLYLYSKSLHVNAFTYYMDICFLWFHSMLFFSSNSGLALLIYRKTCFYSFMLWIFNAQCLHICEIFYAQVIDIVDMSSWFFNESIIYFCTFWMICHHVFWMVAAKILSSLHE